jgi:hypothetical protein
VVLARKPLVFGGGSDQVEIAVTCPSTGRPIQTTILVPNNEEFVRVVLPGQSDPDQQDSIGSADDGTPVDGDDEYADWVKSSRAIGLDFGKTMLTASSGAVAIYFAVLKYLGTEELSKSFSGILSAVPPVLFLVAAAVFAVALRPAVAPVGRAEFSSFRDRRLQQLGRMLTLGIALFGAAMALALCVYADALGLV